MDNMTNRGYSAKIIDCSKELTAREKIRAKDMADAIALDEETKAGDVQIEVDYYLTVQVHNDKADRKDYTKYVIFGKDGNKYVTGSESFWRAFSDIADELLEADAMDEFVIKVLRKPSKNYQGRDFLTCVLA